jgi:glyoxylase-like metal-dependent hydrolase (beta-lactamase superfamily II)
VLIPAGNPTAWTGPTGNNTYLLTGAVPTLIDAGVGNEAHLAAVAEGLRDRALEAILVTHGHRDHTAGIPALVARWPGARVRNFADDVVADGEVIPAGDIRLRAIHTPGHSRDHFCFFDEAGGNLYCGDLARIGGTIVIPASAGGNLAQYLDSLRRIRALAPRRLLPGHGPVVDDPAALIDDYLRHRQERERQIVDALRNGCTSVEDVVRRVYGSLPDTLVRAAADGVVAHLVKLADERRAVEVDGTWQLM